MTTRLERCYPNAPPLYEYPPQPPLPRLPPGKQIPPVPMKPLPPIPTALPQLTNNNYNNNGHPPRNIDAHGTVKNLDSFMPPPLPLLPKSSVSSSSASATQSASSTWSLGTLHHQFLNESKSKASALLDSHDRFKPERSQRRPVQKMKWTQSRLARSLAGDLFSCSPPMMTTMEKGHEPHHLMSNLPRFPKNFISDHLPLESESRVSSMTIADVSPRLAVKKVLLLYEHAQYREAANFIQRLSVGTFRIILRELPLDILIDAMPHSFPILESLYSKVFASDGSTVNLKPLKPDSIVLHMAKFFSQEEIWRESQSRNGKDLIGPFTSGCKEILRVIVIAEPKVMKSLQVRRRALLKAVEGMGQHGLVGTTDESLLPLHDALKLDFRRVVDAYKGALQKLEDLSLSNKNHPKNVSHGPAPIQASHQRQLSLRAEEIQDRLIKNKSLLNVVEPTLDNHCLDILLGILQRRIDCDKEALFQYTQLRKETGDITSESLVAPLLMRYARGCKQVLELMREVAEEAGESLANYEDDSSELSGYHSDSDSAMMTSGNSPFVSPRARYNFLSRSVRCKSLNRPSIISSSSYSPSGVSSADSRSGSSLPDATFSSPPPSLFPSSSSTNPTRPRHVKHRNQLYKNNSLASNSSAESESSQSSVRSEDDAFPSNILESLDPESVDYVTVVTVPENQVISQGTTRRIPAEVKESSEDNRVTELKNEINQLRQTLLNANIKIHQFQEKEKRAEESRAVGNESASISKGKEEIPRGHWVRQYGALYATARVDTMDALDAIPELESADELKSKLLFSVVVLSFRSVQSNVAEVMKRVQVVLQMDSNVRRPNGTNVHQNISSDASENESQVKVLGAVGEYLADSAQNFHLSKSVEQVANQLWSTLYDYPCLKGCEALLKYIRACVTLAWGLTNMTPPCRLEYETRAFRRDMHVRLYSSDPSSDAIKTYLWPALLVQGPTGHCLHKGVVIT